LLTFEAAATLIDEDLAALIDRQPRLIVLPLTGLVPEFQSMPDELRLHLRQNVMHQLGVETPL